MKKKILITLLIGILLVGTIVAVGIAIKEKDIPEEDYNKLASVNSTEITSTDIRCNQDYCDIVYLSTGYGHTSYRPAPYWENCTEYPNPKSQENDTDVFRGECLNYERVYYTNEELEKEKDAKIEDLKNRIIGRLKINEEKDKEKQERVPESIIKYKKPKK